MGALREIQLTAASGRHYQRPLMRLELRFFNGKQENTSLQLGAFSHFDRQKVKLLSPESLM